MSRDRHGLKPQYDGLRCSHRHIDRLQGSAKPARNGTDYVSPRIDLNVRSARWHRVRVDRNGSVRWLDLESESPRDFPEIALGRGTNIGSDLSVRTAEKFTKRYDGF